MEKNMKKRIISLILALLMAASAASMFACDKGDGAGNGCADDT